jgi:ATP-binding cassette subfamily B protein
MRRTLYFVAGLVWRAAAGLTCGYLGFAVITGLLPVAMAWLTKLVLDQLVAGAAVSTLVWLVAGLATAGVVATAVAKWTGYLQAELSRQVGASAVDRLFTAVERFVGLGRFEDPPFQDRLRLAQQAASASSFVVDSAHGVVRAGLTLNGFVISLAILSPAMTAVVLVAAVPTLIAELALARRRAGLAWQLSPTERREIHYANLLSTVEAAKEIRLFGLGGWLRAKMMGERTKANAANRLLDRRNAAVQTGLSTIAAAVAGAGLVLALMSARSGSLSVGDVSMFIAAVAGVQSSLSELVIQYARTHQQLLQFSHYVHVVSAPVDLPQPTGATRLMPLRHGIELRDVWFRYSEDHPWVLRGVHLTIPVGATVALVGHNGAGKSTLVKLLCRFYDPTRGAVLWDGVDLRDIPAAELRRRIGAVFQDYMCYDMTARDNIAVGDLTVGDETRIVTAAMLAGIHDKLSALPNGYDTLLSRMFFSEADKDDPSTGVVLSGGQWQRLALARAFLRHRRDFMILDEPSAGLDAEAEHDVHTRITAHRAGRTSLLISHRLAAVRAADQIVVLADGAVAEQGDHHTLMNAGGSYAKLFRLQAAGYQDDRVPDEAQA